MTEPVWVPARQRSPGHTLCLDAAAASTLSPKSCGLWTPSSEMSLSGHLCFLTIIGLILPTRGQTLKETTPVSGADSTPVNFPALTPPGQTLKETTPVSGADSTPVNFPALTPPVHPEFQPTPQTPSLLADQTLPAQTENQMQQQPTRMDVPLTTDPGADKSSTEAPPTKGTTLSKQSPGSDLTADRALRPTDSSEDNPFFYDVATLRKRGLLVAAVLFITGIVILTSGKCRQWSKLCRNHNRTYRVVTKA